MDPRHVRGDQGPYTLLDIWVGSRDGVSPCVTSEHRTIPLAIIPFDLGGALSVSTWKNPHLHGEDLGASRGHRHRAESVRSLSCWSSQFSSQQGRHLLVSRFGWVHFPRSRFPIPRGMGVLNWTREPDRLSYQRVWFGFTTSGVQSTTWHTEMSILNIDLGLLYSSSALRGYSLLMVPLIVPFYE